MPLRRADDHVLVTGASGFLGSAIVRELQRRGASVIALTKTRSLGINASEGVRLVPADLHDYPLIKDLLAELRPTACIHAAWDVSHDSYQTSPENARWVDSSLALAVMARHYGSRWFCGFGTCLEHLCNTARETPYAIAKWQLRTALSLLAADDRRMQTCWLRAFQPYGPGEDERRLIPSMIRTLRGGQSFIIEQPSETRDFIHADDVGSAVADCWQRQACGEFDLGMGLGHRLEAVGLMAAELMGVPSLIKVGVGSGRPLTLVADTRPLHIASGWLPTIELRQGLRKLIGDERGRKSAA